MSSARLIPALAFLFALLFGTVVLHALASVVPPLERGLALVAAWSVSAWVAVGPVIVGLVPLGLWLLSLLANARSRLASDPERQIANYAFIGRNATLLGLLGTVLSLALAGAQLAAATQIDSAVLINGLVGLLGQALVSTVVGIIIALVADVGLHLAQRHPTAPEGSEPAVKVARHES